MESRLLGKCRFCGAEVLYQDGQELVKCSSCGQTLAIAEFLNEQVRIQKVLEEAERAKERLKAAEAEREQALQQLLQTVRSLGNIDATLQEQQNTLMHALQELKAGNETQEAAMHLFDAFRQGQEQGQNQTISMLRESMDRQEDAAEKLRSLEATAKQLAASQAAHDADTEWLKKIADASGRLEKEQEKTDGRIRDLREKISEANKSIAEFEKHWKQSELQKLAGMYLQAESLQNDRAFDKAEDMYRQVLIQGGADPEVYWRIILCHYCVVYQRDNEGNPILTILYPDLSDPEEMSDRRNLLSSIASTTKEEYYTGELARLDGVLEKYREVYHQVKYDVFISVKQATWQKGKKYYTTDHKMGLDLYEHLSSLGLRVFNSEAPACKCPAGQEWEPYILAALLSAKVMIVVGTCREHMESQWVKNEWSRFLWLQKHEDRSGKGRRNLFCYISDSMNPYDIPKGLEPDRQAIVNSAVAFSEIDSEMKRAFPSLSAEPDPVQAPGFPELSEELGRMETWLSLEKYERITQEYNLLVDRGIYLNSSRIHLYSICAEYKVKDIRLLAEKVPGLLNDNRFINARECAADEAEKDLINDLVEKRRELDQARQKKRKKTIRILTVAALVLLAAGTLFLIVRYMGTGSHETKEPGVAGLTQTNAPAEAPTEAPTEELTEAPAAEPLFTPAVGRVVSFGKYEQDNNTKNGNEDIEWIILDIQGEQCLLLSKYGLDAQPYDNNYGHVWETCSLRKWLNNEFLGSAFNNNERAAIIETCVDNGKSQGYPGGQYSGNDTYDSVFLLSYAEADKYLTQTKRTTRFTEYGRAQCPYPDTNGNYEWWLRIVGDGVTYYVSDDGRILRDVSTAAYGMVRPAIWVKKSAID